MEYPVTPDGRYFVVRGRLWRMSNPALSASEREHLVAQLMKARREVGLARDALEMGLRWRRRGGGGHSKACARRARPRVVDRRRAGPEQAHGTVHVRRTLVRGSAPWVADGEPPWQHRVMARALKVYCMPAGFYDAVVAAPSQGAALKAWGTTTDLFAAGRARVVTDEAIRAEALARPGEVIKRSRGDEAAMLGPEPSEEPEGRGKPARKLARPKPPPPDRSDLNAAERQVAESERELSAELDGFAAERIELDRRQAEARATGEARVVEAQRARDRAQAVYDRAVARTRA